MKKVQYTAFGDPLAVLTVETTNAPEAHPGQVRIRTIIAPIHTHDLVTVEGSYGLTPSLPSGAGSEACGIVDAVGLGVGNVKIGQRVVAFEAEATWADYFVAPAENVFALPDTIDDETGCQILAMPLNAQIILEWLQVAKGQWMLINAANGAVGKSLAMLASTRGISTISLVRRDSAIEQLNALGITHVISTEKEGWQKKVQDIIGDVLLAGGVDFIGGTATGELASMLAKNGTLVIPGAASGDPMVVSSRELIFKQLDIRGYWGHSAKEILTFADKERLVNELFQLAASGVLQLPVEAVYQLSDITKAVKAARKPHRKGKVLLKA